MENESFLLMDELKPYLPPQTNRKKAIYTQMQLNFFERARNLLYIEKTHLHH
jgi:hypothetical protein